MFIFWFLETRHKPLVYGVKASYWPLVFTWKFTRFWNQRSLPLCKPKRYFLITTCYCLKRLSNALMNTVNFFPQKVINSVWAWCAPIPFLRYHTVRLLCTQLKSRFRNSFIYCASNFLKPLGWSVSSSDSHKDFQNSVTSSTLPNNVSPLPSSLMPASYVGLDHIPSVSQWSS